MIRKAKLSTIIRPIDLQEQRLISTSLNKGMITTIDPSDIDPSALVLAKNVTIRHDKLKRRAALSLFTPSKPDTKPILNLSFIKFRDGASFTIRMTPTSLFKLINDGWTTIDLAVPLNGTIKDRFTTANILNKFIFSNNGADPIQTIDFDTYTCSQLGNAPAYRYVAGFFNRAVGFALRGENEVEVGWSADGDSAEWDQDVNDTAGSAPILESPADLSDFITGGLSFSNVMIVFREKSIWLATKQPIPQNPFYFYTAVPGIGCNCPFSIKIIDSGASAFVDQRSQRVYAYQPGNQPEPISTFVERDIFSSIDDPGAVFAAYNALQHEYSIYIPQHNGSTKAWCFNFITKSWAYNEFENLTSANDVEVAEGGITIDELVGTIDDLGDTPIDDLSGDVSLVAIRTYGNAGGDIFVEDSNLDQDTNVNYETEIRSKSFNIPELNVHVCKIVIQYSCSRASNLILSYSKDGGLTWIIIKDIEASIFNKPQLLIMKRLIRARNFIWRLVSTKGDVEILQYEIYVTPSGEQVNAGQ